VGVGSIPTRTFRGFITRAHFLFNITYESLSHDWIQRVSMPGHSSGLSFSYSAPPPGDCVPAPSAVKHCQRFQQSKKPFAREIFFSERFKISYIFVESTTPMCSSLRVRSADKALHATTIAHLVEHQVWLPVGVGSIPTRTFAALSLGRIFLLNDHP
jgi:hypothetical protein